MPRPPEQVWSSTLMNEGMTLSLEAEIEEIYADSEAKRDARIDQLLTTFRQGLNRGEIRAAVFDGRWKTNVWVKKALSLCVRFGRLTQSAAGAPIDLDTLPRREFSLEDGVRVTDAGCFVRDGACVSAGCTLMPATVVQMGAYVGPQTVVGEGVSIGVCAQIGARVHLNPGVKIHGQLQPLEGLPAIVGDGASIGANCVIGAGVIVGPGAVIFPGTILLWQTRLYDPLRKHRFLASEANPLMVPPGAIVVPGSRSLAKGAAGDALLSVQIGVIAGYITDHNLPAALLDRLLED
ncbi:MAG TPA: hypothetical protein VFA54_00865 [Bryobacterales bacterium]|nr:hypothetical protein [Bryobacterales bacterium]